jgi:hypothetical protein
VVQALRVEAHVRTPAPPCAFTLSSQHNVDQTSHSFIFILLKESESIFINVKETEDQRFCPEILQEHQTPAAGAGELMTHDTFG